MAQLAQTTQAALSGQSKTVTVTVTGTSPYRTRVVRAAHPRERGEIAAPPSSPANFTLTRATHFPTRTAGEHEHVISGYSLLKGIGDGEPIASDRFTVGGHEWVLLFYPDGKRSISETQQAPPPNDDPYAALFVALIGEGPRPQGVVHSSSGRVVRAFHRFTLVDQTGTGNRDITKGHHEGTWDVLSVCDVTGRGWTDRDGRVGENVYMFYEQQTSLPSPRSVT